MSLGRIDAAVNAAVDLSSKRNAQLHAEAIPRKLSKSGLKLTKEKPCRSEKQQKIECAQSFTNWTPEAFKRLIWSDETKNTDLVQMALLWDWKQILDHHVLRTFKYG